MSAPTTGKNGKKPGQPPRQEKPDMDPSELMRAMGGNGWFNPESNDMITWLLTRKEVPRPVIRMYAWMKVHTTMQGNRQPYANQQGTELHLNHMAADLGYDMINLRAYWRWGVEFGLWRGGTETEGTKRLYLCAKIELTSDPEPEEASKQVCTNSSLYIYQRVKPYLKQQLEKLPFEVVQAASDRYERLDKLVGKTALAEVVSTVRTVKDQLEDTIWRDIGVEKIRLERDPGELSPEEAAAEAARARRMAALLPHVEQFVQTVLTSVQTMNSSSYNEESVSVQTPEERAKTPPAKSANPMQPRPVTNGTVAVPQRAPSLLEPVRNSQTPEQAGVSSSPVRASGASNSLDGEKSVQLPAGELRLLNSLKPEERAGAEKLLALIENVWRKDARKFSGEAPNPKDHGQLATAAKMVRMVGLDELDEFGLYIEQKASGRALGYKLTIALLSKIAEEFRDGAADRDRQRQAVAEQLEKARERVRAAKERQQREAETVERVDAAWEKFSVGEQMERLRAEGEALKADPHYQSVYRHNEPERRRQMELRAKRRLRLEIEARGPDGTRASKD